MYEAWMKNITLILIGLMTYNLALGKANYKVAEGKLHKGGKATVSILDNLNRYSLKMTYQLEKKKLVPVPEKHLSGETTIDLPLQFKDERGYLELEEKKEMNIEGAKLTYLGRTHINNLLKDAHRIMVHLKNGKGRIELVYHPNLDVAGWEKLTMTFISDIPLLNGYRVTCELIKK